jgi:hypothetical protein
MAEKKITTSDLRKTAQELLKSGKMPSIEDFAKAMNEERASYVPKVHKLRDEEPEGGAEKEEE